MYATINFKENQWLPRRISKSPGLLDIICTDEVLSFKDTEINISDNALRSVKFIAESTLILI